MVQFRVALALLLLTAELAVISACDRPWVEPQRPTLDIVAPDLETVVPDDSIILVVRADAFRTVESVAVDGLPLIFDEDEQVWARNVPLQSGLNRLLLSVTDSDGQTVQDTAYAYRGALDGTRDAAALPVGRGGHSATILEDGSIFVLGGSPRFSEPARSDGVLLPPDAQTFRPIAAQMLAGRSGHTATILPDGRILIVGGSRHFVVDELEDLIETVEIYDPQTQQFATVPFSGAPIRRAYHTAVLRLNGGDVLLDLFGGEGDIRYSPSPLLGTRNDIRSFVLRNDSLIARSPAPGPNLGFSFAGHTQTPLQSAGAGRMLIAGTSFGEAETLAIAAIIDYGAPGGLLPRGTGTMRVPRTQHAAERLKSGHVFVIGGHQGTPSTSIADAEIYAEEAGRFFRFPRSSDTSRRFGMTATKLSDERILILGGFTPSGDGIVFSESILVTAP